MSIFDNSNSQIFLDGKGYRIDQYQMKDLADFQP
jgi:hypothetical protein